jgi:hypothetical protein
MANDYPTFGRFPNDITPRLTSVRGESGWLTLPQGWFAKPNPNIASELIASPNQDFSSPVYYCTMSDDGQTFAFQDLLILKMLGLDNPNGLKHPL